MNSRVLRLESRSYPYSTDDITTSIYHKSLCYSIMIRILHFDKRIFSL